MRIFIIFLLGALPCFADELYLVMVGATETDATRPPQICIPVKDKDDATKQMLIHATNEFAGLTWEAFLHNHKPGQKGNSCEEDNIGKGTDKIADMSKSVEVVEESNDKTKLPIHYRIPVTDKTDAAKKEAQIKAEFPDKNFTSKTNGTVTAQ